MFENFMTSKEAAQSLNRSDSMIRKLCKSGKLSGAVKVGNTWLIPQKSVKEYTPAPNGFTVVWAKKLAREYLAQKGYTDNVSF